LKTEAVQKYYEQNPSAQWLALASISIASFVISLTMSAVNVSVPAIALDLNANAVLVSWIPTAFLLGNAILLLPAGRLADIHGRKKIFLTGMSVFTAACLMGHLAPTIEILLFTRLLQGLAGALCFATGLAIVMTIFTSNNRGMALGVASATLYLGLSCGPVIGGWFTEHYGWRSVFLFPLVLGFISTLLVVFRLKGEWKSEQAQPVDWFGGAIFAVWASCLFIGISNIPHPASYLLIISGIVLMIYFYHQQVNSDYPLIRFKAILENRIFSRSLMSNICIYASNYPFIFLFSLYLQFIQGMSPASAGQLMVLQPIMMAIVAPIAGRLSDQFEARVIATLGCLVMAAAFGILQVIDTGTSSYVIGVALMTLGVGFGLFTTPNNNAALSSVEKSRLAIASALLNLARVSGNMIGTGIVLMLVSIFIGQVKIEPIQYPALLIVIHLALGTSCLLSLTASYFSYSRGNVRDQ
jgi:EmrB/QacA subfamily drug resistance transporter